MKRTSLMAALDIAKQAEVADDKLLRGLAAEARRPPKPSKRRDPEYMQICILVRKATYNQVRRRLIGGEMDASDLVESLLTEWLDRGDRK